jgi:hypothetical protein
MSQSGRKLTLEERVARAAETALSRQQYVSAIDVLCGMGLLLPTHVDSWRNGGWITWSERFKETSTRFLLPWKYSGVGLGKKA